MRYTQGNQLAAVQVAAPSEPCSAHTVHTVQPKLYELANRNRYAATFATNPTCLVDESGGKSRPVERAAF